LDISSSISSIISDVSDPSIHVLCVYYSIAEGTVYTTVGLLGHTATQSSSEHMTEADKYFSAVQGHWIVEKVKNILLRNNSTYFKIRWH
jgi:hypothetical protein